MKNFQKSLTLVALAFTVGGCGKARDAFKLQGTYQTQADKELTVRGVNCVVRNVEVSGFDMTMTETSFADPKCGGNPLGVITTQGTFTVGAELAIEPGAKEMDLTIRSVTAKTLDSSWGSLAGLIDLTGQCNIRDLAVGSTLDVTGLDCGSLDRFPAKDQIFFTSFNLQNDTLRFTKFPSKSLANVGTKAAPAPRNTDLEGSYLRKN